MSVCLTPPSASATCKTCGQSTLRNHILLGYYSATAERTCGSWEVETVDGKWVRITAMLSDPSCYKWKDARFVGEVITGSQRNHYPGNMLQDDFGSIPEDSEPKPLQLGETCFKCKAVVKERQLLTSTYIGCMC